MYLSYQPVCVAALGSMTMAVKARQELTAAGIRAEIIALSPGETRRGCAYGVEYPCAVESAARARLRAARIPVSQYMRKGRSN